MDWTSYLEGLTLTLGLLDPECWAWLTACRDRDYIQV